MREGGTKAIPVLIELREEEESEDTPPEEENLEQMVQRRMRSLQGVLGHLGLPQGDPMDEVRGLWNCQALAVGLSPTAIDQIARSPLVVGLHLNRQVQARQPSQASSIQEQEEFRGELGLDGLDPSTLPGGRGLVIGHMDSGVDPEHPTLKNRIVDFKDFTGGRVLPYDNDGHGTHTAGILLGSKPLGLLPEAKLKVAKVTDSCGRARLGHLLEGMGWMVDPRGSKEIPPLVYNSWGMPLDEAGDTSRLFARALKTWNRAGVLGFFPIGDRGPGTELLPACLPLARSL